MPYKKATVHSSSTSASAGLKTLGRKKWKAAVFDVVARLKAAFVADYVVLGGGNVKKLDEMRPGARRGDNNIALTGGERLWAKKAAHLR